MFRSWTSRRGGRSSAAGGGIGKVGISNTHDDPNAMGVDASNEVSFYNKDAYVHYIVIFKVLLSFISEI